MILRPRRVNNLGVSRKDCRATARRGHEPADFPADHLVRARLYDEAIEVLLEATRPDPENATVPYNLGCVYLVTRRVTEAITWLRRSIDVDPSFARAHFLLGVALQQSGQDDVGAVAAYRRALALEPDFPEAHALLADLLWDNGLRDEAAAWYERAAASAPSAALRQGCRAKALSERRPDEALEGLAQIVASDPSCSEAHLAMGQVLAEVGRFDEAAASFERAIAAAPELATAHQGLVSCRPITQAERPWLERILTQIESPDLGVRERMTFHFAAGKALDDLGNYAAAIQHFDAANGLRRRHGSPLDREGVGKLVDALAARFTPESFRTEATRDPSAPTPLFIVGLPRSGTTLLERIVSAHSAVAGGGEIVFWSDHGPEWLRGEPGAGLEERIRADYQHLLRRVSSEANWVTDKNTFNWPWVGLAHLLFPNARFIHCRRNPVDTCLSIYTTPLGHNWGFASERGDLAAYCRLYRRMVAHWRAVLPPDRWLDVDYEEVTRAPEGAARRLLAFVGLSWDPACLRPDQNPDPVKTSNVWPARQPIFQTSVGRARNYEAWLGELRELDEK
jgi:tetratricopeptide (TPR) repeat protein